MTNPLQTRGFYVFCVLTPCLTLLDFDNETWRLDTTSTDISFEFSNDNDDVIQSGS